MIYGYVRVSTAKQSIERQIKNIEAMQPDEIFTDKFTGTKMERPGFNKLLLVVRPGDTIVFDEVSRMARNAVEGFQLYKDLYNNGIELVFLKDHSIDTKVFRDAMHAQVQTINTGNADSDFLVNGIMNVLNEYNMRMAEKQIQIAFEKAESEVEYLHRRTSEGIREAKAAGKQVGQVAGAKLTTKKSVEAKKVIKQHSVDFGGSLSDTECMKLTGLSRNTFYKYKKELKSE